ncbi:MAG TPA: PVC-type heme-binding CxxCH protein [Fimbriiglobus sp.]|nr:PVC-type heme-binding CxxCH protein [Fimbriiglobus sp.]
MLRVLICVAALGCASQLTAADPATVQVKLNGQTFTLPTGFEIEQVAGPPLTKRPVAAAFDEKGVLYVTEASGTNDPVKKQLADMPHTLLRLTDQDGDGKFDSGGVFADRLMLPQGVMCLDGSVYVGHPPVITKFTGTDKAEKRETWFDGKTLTGCANDLHGPYPGPDGWVYWTKGAFAKQDYILPTGKAFSTRAAHIFRARPDGTGVEPVMTGGMDNPVDVTFTPAGERIFTTTFFQIPGGGWRDGLIHAVYGGVYGKDHDPVHEHPWTGPELMPVLTHMGAAAPCGLHRYESSAFGPEYRDNLFACSFNMHKVTRHVLVPDGATFKTTDSDFITSVNLDFHPTDVIEDADGSLLVVDTGGWYKLCCPTSQLVKPDIFGAIYRVKRKGAKPADDPRGRKIDWDKLPATDLARLLDDPRPVVRNRAVEALGKTPEEALLVVERVLRESKSSEARRNALWAAARFDLSPARTVHPTPGQPHALLSCVNVARAALSDPDESVRGVALHLLSLYRDKGAVPALAKLLENGTPRDRRGAAEALGRIGGKVAVPALLAAHRGVSDRVLQHSLTYALIEIGDRKQTAKGMKDSDPLIRRAALVTLGQLKDGLTAQQAAAELSATDPPVREAAWWVVGRHPEWGDTLAGFFRDRFTAAATPAERDELAGRLATFARSEAIAKLLADRMADASASPESRRVALKAASAAGLRQPPPSWYEAAAKVLAEGKTVLVGDAVALARTLPAPKPPRPEFAASLRAVAADPKLPAEFRYQSLAAVPGGPGKLTDSLFAELTFAIRREQPVGPRASAADVLSRATLTPDQLVSLAGVLRTAGPLELDRLLEPFARSTEDRVGAALLDALQGSSVRSGLRIDMLRPRLAKYSPAVQTKAESLYHTLNADAAAQRTKLEALLAESKDGDVRRGHAVFNSAKAACITCHQMGYLGGKVGPDLTRIGGVRTERDLLEAVAFPNASFVRSYEPVKVTTLDGRAFQGVLKADTPDEVVLTTSATEEVRIPRKDIDELTPGTVSVMPSGLDQQLTKQELADLLAFLKASK